MSYGLTRLEAWPKPIEGRAARPLPVAPAPQTPAPVAQTDPHTPPPAAQPKPARKPRAKLQPKA